jgi:hypothetical protein
MWPADNRLHLVRWPYMSKLRYVQNSMSSLSSIDNASLPLFSYIDQLPVLALMHIYKLKSGWA